MSPALPSRHLARLAGLALLVALGCGDRSPAVSAASKPLSPKEAEAAAAIKDELSTIINDASLRFKPLSYEYNEDLLAIVDKAEAQLSGKSDAKAPRAMPKLDEAEESDHFRETIRRWSAKTGKDLRPEIDRLKADVAARKPGGSPFHPEFQKDFAAVFDDFIAIEVAEIRERRNRQIHERAAPLFDRYRAEFPGLVAEEETKLNRRPYNLPGPGGPPESGTAPEAGAPQPASKGP